MTPSSPCLLHVIDKEVGRIPVHNKPDIRQIHSHAECYRGGAYNTHRACKLAQFGPVIPANCACIMYGYTPAWKESRSGSLLETALWHSIAEMTLSRSGSRTRSVSAGLRQNTSSRDAVLQRSGRTRSDSHERGHFLVTNKLI